MKKKTIPENHLDNDKDLQELFPCINCGINADPADGFGNCTCGNEKLREEIDQYTQSKLKAFAGDMEEAIGEDLPIGDEIEENRSYTGERIYNKRNEELRQALKAIKERWNI